MEADLVMTYKIKKMAWSLYRFKISSLLRTIWWQEAPIQNSETTSKQICNYALHPFSIAS